MKGHNKDYKFGPKNNWRRWFWNDVLRRTNGREKAEIILYLAGSQDLDRAVVGRRVPDRNLIAIDRYFNNVANIRESGHYAIHADALEALRAWPVRQAVCAVVLDLCSGLWEVEELARLSMLMMAHPAFMSAVLAANFQRGRELATNKMIHVSDQLNWDAIHRDFGINIGPKHRGFMLACSHATMASMLACGSPQETASALKCLSPSFSSYKSSSGSLIFDSVVMVIIYLTNRPESSILQAWRTSTLPKHFRKRSFTLPI